jgi:lysozyme
MSNWIKKLRVFPPDYAQPKQQSTAVKKFLLFLIFFFGATLFMSPYLRYRVISLIEYPIHYKEYKHFGIRIPRGYTVHGIDVSRWQLKVDWSRVKKMEVNDIRIHFAFIKATEGTWKTDPRFYANWETARRNGIVRGAYHFFLPQISAKDQAKHFTQTVKLKSGDLPPVVDVEETHGMNKAQVQKYTKEFMDLLEKHYKIKPILYTNLDFYKNYFYEHPDFKPYYLWIAHYHVNEVDMPGDDKWLFWQHSDRGNVNGINEPVDFNVFSGNLGDLQKISVP